MAQLMKHVGKFGEKPCIVIMRKLPDDDGHCLVTVTGNVPDRMHDELMSAVQSAECQNENSLADGLARKTFSDGTQMLTKLHYSKYIQKVPVSLVTMTPAPNQAITLTDLNEAIKQQEAGIGAPITDESHLKESTTRQPQQPAEPEAPAVQPGAAPDDVVGLEPTAPVADAVAAPASAESDAATAETLTTQAVDLEKEAKKMLQQAAVLREQAGELQRNA